MSTEYYYRATHLANICNKDHLTEAKNAEYSCFVVEKHSGKKPSSVQAPTSFENSKFIADLRDKFTNVRTHYLKFDAMTCYDWHTDMARNCSINFLLNDPEDSLTLFREPLAGINYQITRLKYNLFEPTLLDVKKTHCVINFSPEVRYVLTVGFTLDVTYDQVKQFLQSYSPQI